MIFLDFEYNNTSSAKLNLVCCSLYNSKISEQGVVSYWLYDNDTQPLVDYLNENIGETLCCFSGEAEASSLISLGIDPYLFKWIDLAAEWKLLINHCNDYRYGAQLIDGKIVVTSPPPQYKRLKIPGVSNAPPSTSLAAAIFKMLGKKIDTSHKTFIRDIIISNNTRIINENKQAIIDYCDSDVLYLEDLAKALRSAIIQKSAKFAQVEYEVGANFRGMVSGPATAHLVRKGYPINYDKLRTLSNNVPTLLEDLKADASQRVYKHDGFVPFPYSMALKRRKMDQKSIKNFLRASGYVPGETWDATEKKDFSLSEEAFRRYCSERHNYSDGLFSQMIRFSATNTAISSMKPEGSTTGKCFWDSVGPDRRVRPYLNPYGAQSGRFQPAATGFLLLKSAWMRCLLQPPPGKVIIGIDYSQQEFLLNAILSGDTGMMEAYKSGDIYLHTAKLDGRVPKDGTKKTHQKERDLYKALVLGLGFLMTEHGLSYRIEQSVLSPEDSKVGEGHRFSTTQHKVEYLKEVAAEYIERYKALYPTYFQDYVETVQDNYIIKKGMSISKYWMMFGDNLNEKSVVNAGTQGAGANILHRAIPLIQREGLRLYRDPLVICPLHDATYCEVPEVVWKECTVMIRTCMISAFTDWLKENYHGRVPVPTIRCDVEAWGDIFKDNEGTIRVEDFNRGVAFDVECQHIHVDSRGVEEYKNWERYLTEDVSNFSELFE